MSKNLLVFSRNLLSVSGGAELSLRKEILKSSREFEYIYIYSFGIDDMKNLPKNCHLLSFPFLKNKYIARLPYIEYVLYRKKIKKILNDTIINNEISDIWGQNIWVSVIQDSKLTVFLRDENSLSIRPIYNKNWRYLISLFLRIIEYPFFKIHSKDTKKTYWQSKTIIANSLWMKKKLIEKFDVNESKVIVKYPDIDENELKSLYASGVKKSLAVVMIGSEHVKGIEVFIELAFKFPKEIFYIYSKYSIKEKLPINVQVFQWSNDRSEPYRQAKVIIVPSIWNEAFGRVAAEAKVLGIPVLVSGVGGLPEAVNYDSNLIAIDRLDFENKLERILECAG